MEPLARVLFDECISKLLVKDLAAFFARDFPDVEVRHVLDTFKPGTHDGRWLDWLTLTTKDSRLMPLVITADRGKKSKLKKDKLPLICERLGIPYVALTSGLLTSPSSIHRVILTGAWAQMVEIARRRPPENHSLGIGQAKGGLMIPKLRRLEK